MQYSFASCKKLDKLFILYLFANPVFDILNGMVLYISRQYGYNIKSYEFPITPTLIIRMAFLIAMAVYLLSLKDKSCFRFLIPIGAAGLMSVIVEFAQIEMTAGRLFADVQYLARFVYNLVAFYAYYHVFHTSGHIRREEALSLLRRFFCWSAALISLSILLCGVFKLGFKSYADRFGLRGISGFYYSANEATAMLMLVLPIALYEFMQSGSYKDKKNWWWLAIPSLTINAMLLIGTKTAYLALLGALGATGLFAFFTWKRNKSSSLFKRFGALLLSIVLLFGLLNLVTRASLLGSIKDSTNALQLITDEEPDDETFSHLPPDMAQALANSPAWVRLIFSGRQYYVAKAADEWIARGAPAWLVGMGRGSQDKVIEMDFFEIFFYYGLVGFVLMLLPYWKLGRRLFPALWQNRQNLLAVNIGVGLLLTVLYAFMAGHVFFSVTGGFYLAITLLYGTLLFAQAPAVEIPPGKKKKIV